MTLHSTMTPQEWKELLNFLTGQGARIAYLAETDNNGLFVGYRYALVEYKGDFYYMWNPLNMFEDFEVIRYKKVSPYEKQQTSYPRRVCSTDELFDFMNEDSDFGALRGTHKQRIYLTELYRLKNHRTDLWRLENELAGYREKDILANLTHITMPKHTKDYCVLRFHSREGNYFDYETKSHRITG